jgi:hypothetical protein
MQAIEIVKGTTNIFQVIVFDKFKKKYEPSSNEVLVFGIKQDCTQKSPIFQIESMIGDDNEIYFKIKPDHTQNLSCGEYVYDVGLVSGSDFYNIIEPSPFFIRENVTIRG